MKVVLLSIYDLGHQPFSLASAAAALRRAGHEVTMIDLSVDALPSLPVRQAEWIAVSLPMHTATRLTAQAVGRVRALNPSAPLCAFGLYAALNADYLRSLGFHQIVSGEWEESLVRLAAGQNLSELVVLDRLQFATPDRRGLPALARYPKLRVDGAARRVGYTEASRGCKHLCRHCPIVPVYNGAFRVVQPEVVLEDIRRQIDAGAEHITFGDPDFLNGPTHARRILEQFHSLHPQVTWDATIKIEHLLKHRDLLPLFKASGCLFITTAVESLDDAVLQRLDKGHTRLDFFETVQLFRETGLTLSPTFIPFTPWTTQESYRDLLSTLARLDLVEHVSPVQLALRLLIPHGSRLLELDEIQSMIGPWDPGALLYRWRNQDPAVDALAANALNLVHREQKLRTPRRAIFGGLWELAFDEPWYEDFSLLPRAAIPYLDEPWYC